jgi:cytochrome c-type biogenesis protein CcmH
MIRRRWRRDLGFGHEAQIAGDSDAVIDLLVARYGEFVLLKPRVNQHTLLLWLVPPLALLGGGFAMWRYSRRRPKSGDDTDESVVKLTADEQARVEQLLAAEPAPEKPL